MSLNKQTNKQTNKKNKPSTLKKKLPLIYDMTKMNQFNGYCSDFW